MTETTDLRTLASMIADLQRHNARLERALREAAHALRDSVGGNMLENRRRAEAIRAILDGDES